MKRLSIFCCLVLLLNVLCPVGHVHAEGVTTPTDLCNHQYAYWANGDDCVYGCTLCDTVVSIGEHEEGWSSSNFVNAGAEGHHRTCANCNTIMYTDWHSSMCSSPNACYMCGYVGADGEITDIWHSFSDPVVVEPDGCKDGSSTCVCDVCDYIDIVVLSGNGQHTWNAETGLCDYCGVMHEHTYGYWADGDNCIRGCTICHTVESVNSHSANSTYISDGAEGHHVSCQNCGAAMQSEAHDSFCSSANVCYRCGYEGEIASIVHLEDDPKPFDEKQHVYFCIDCGCVVEYEVHEAFCNDPTLCLPCGYRGTIDRVIHSYTLDVTTVEPDGCKDGSKTSTCPDCNEVVEVVVLPGNGQHTYGEAVVVPASCTADGSKTYTCTVCGNVKVEAIPATGEHTYGEPVIVYATCIADGSKTYTCTVCGDVKVEVLPATGNHDWGCWADGEDCVWGCPVCKDESYRSMHEASCVDPTCCKYCGAEGEWDFAHTFDYYGNYGSKGVVNDGPEGHHFVCIDCGESGEQEKHYADCDYPTQCRFCGYEGEIADLYHYGYGEAKFDETGHWYVCDECGENYDFSEHFNDCIDPTHCAYCAYEGQIADENLWHGDMVYVFVDEECHRFECSICGYVVYEDTHNADCSNPNYCVDCGYEGPCEYLYHDYAYVSDDADTHTGTCTRCGNSYTSEHYTWCDDPNHCQACDYEGVIADVAHFWDGYEGADEKNHWHICPECGITIMSAHWGGECGVETPCDGCDTPYVQEHFWSDPVTNNNTKTYTCYLCGETRVENLHNHNWGDPVTVDPTCTADGTATYTCTCGATREETIAALGHSFGLCVPTGTGEHTQACTQCGVVTASTCTMTDTKIGDMDASACVYCGYITWNLADATDGKQTGKAVENAAFQMMDETGAAVEANNLSLVVYESAPEATIQLDTGVKVTVKKALTITVLEDNIPVKLGNTVKLSIPVEDDLTGLKLLVVDENGQLIEITYEVVDGMMVFETNILGIFMLVEEI